MDAATARTRIAEIRAAGGKTTIDELDDLWAALPAVTPDDILGSWRGSEFVSGHRFEGYLPKIRWHGKRFTSRTDVAPLVCRDDNGNLFDDTERAKGGASLWTVEFRGEPTATMVYDGQPILDHFKRIDDHSLLGVMNGKGVLDDGRHYYFVLELSRPETANPSHPEALGRSRTEILDRPRTEALARPRTEILDRPRTEALGRSHSETE